MEPSSNNKLLAQDKNWIAPLYGKADIDLVEGKGSYLFDVNGKKYLDFVAGIAVNALGQCHPAVVKAMQDQICKFSHLSNLYPNYPQINLAKKMLEITKFDKAFFCNSGTEANEGAIKLARKYFSRKGETDRVQIVTFVNSFHGRTFGALAATGQPSLREGFGSMPGDFVHIPWNDVDALKQIVNEKTCAIMLEPLVAEGGVMTLSDAMAKTINALRAEFGCLVIADEIQTGIGRLGTFLGVEFYGIHADLVTFAKAIGAGLPLGAVLMRQRLADQFRAGDHGTTFGGNPVACAGGLAMVNIVSEPAFLESVRARSVEFKKGLNALIAKYSFLGTVRGEGLLLGVTTEKPVAEIIAAVRAEGLLIHRAGVNVIRFLPPLNVSREEVQEALMILDHALAKM